jgi:hypothetical protein
MPGFLIPSGAGASGFPDSSFCMISTGISSCKQSRVCFESFQRCQDTGHSGSIPDAIQRETCAGIGAPLLEELHLTGVPGVTGKSSMRPAANDAGNGQPALGRSRDEDRCPLGQPRYESRSAMGHPGNGQPGASRRRKDYPSPAPRRHIKSTDSQRGDNESSAPWWRKDRLSAAWRWNVQPTLPWHRGCRAWKIERTVFIRNEASMEINRRDFLKLAGYGSAIYVSGLAGPGTVLCLFI